ncbi:MAG: hypothetical protein LBG13_00790, partial [Holosporales bacterium]|nr:hypothetical protein [Holosporales bacterium]
MKKINILVALGLLNYIMSASGFSTVLPISEEIELLQDQFNYLKSLSMRQCVLSDKRPAATLVGYPILPNYSIGENETCTRSPNLPMNEDEFGLSPFHCVENTNESIHRSVPICSAREFLEDLEEEPEYEKEEKRDNPKIQTCDLGSSSKIPVCYTPSCDDCCIKTITAMGTEGRLNWCREQMSGSMPFYQWFLKANNSEAIRHLRRETKIRVGVLIIKNASVSLAILDKTNTFKLPSGTPQHIHKFKDILKPEEKLSEKGVVMEHKKKLEELKKLSEPYEKLSEAAWVKITKITEACQMEYLLLLKNFREIGRKSNEAIEELNRMDFAELSHGAPDCNDKL